MDFRFSDNVKNLNPSAIREILKYASDPEVVSLSAGNPAPEAFPVEDIRRISDRILTERPIDALQYSTTEGYGPLRSHLTAYMKQKHGIGRDFDDILITSGAQQAIELCVKALCNDGRCGHLRAAQLCGHPQLHPFPGRPPGGRAHGGATAWIWRRWRQRFTGQSHRQADLYHPQLSKPLRHHHEYGQKRRRLYALAKAYGVLVLEDNPYGDLRFDGEHVPAIKSLDEDGIVLYAGTFSKVLSPGIRVGYAIATGGAAAKDDRLQAGGGRAHRHLGPDDLPTNS